MIDTGDQTGLGLRRRDLFGKLYRQSLTVPLNRVVMASYIPLKANKIAAIRFGDISRGWDRGEKKALTDRMTGRHERGIKIFLIAYPWPRGIALNATRRPALAVCAKIDRVSSATGHAADFANIQIAGRVAGD